MVVAKSRINESELKHWRGDESANYNSEGKVTRTIQYPMKLRDDIGSCHEFIFSCTEAMNKSTVSISQIISDIKGISSERRNTSEQFAKYSTYVDPVVLLHYRQDHDQSNHVCFG